MAISAAAAVRDDPVLIDVPVPSGPGLLVNAHRQGSVPRTHRNRFRHPIDIKVTSTTEELFFRARVISRQASLGRRNTAQAGQPAASVTAVPYPRHCQEYS